uniref:Uncharacterized protein n=1 Tax=Romanomermis culicivorax TaxID=13658 RepID=A0A915JSN2_ROMCU
AKSKRPAVLTRTFVSCGLAYVYHRIFGACANNRERYLKEMPTVILFWKSSVYEISQAPDPNKIYSSYEG